MNWTWYRAGRCVTRSILFCTMRVRTLRPDVPDLPGGYVLALSHQGHLDPFLASTLQQRPIAWMTRKEFFRYGWARLLIRKLNGFRVDRQGTPVSAVRHAISLAKSGEIVGICPEGGVVCGADACFRGGPLRRGFASVAIRAQVPVVPAIILGTARLSRVDPWLPAKRGRLWVAYAPPIPPPPGPSTRAARAALAAQLQSAYTALYAEMLPALQVDPAWVA